MAKITHVAVAKKAPGTCRTCRQPIDVGVAYKHFSKRYLGKFVYHETCSIPSSHQTSGKTAQLLEIGEALDSAIGQASDFDDLMGALEEASEAAGGLADEYEESVSNIVDGFGHETSVSEDMQERADSIRQWADELDNARSEIDGLKDEYDEAERELDEMEGADVPDDKQDESDARKLELEELVEGKLDEARDVAINAAGDQP